MLNQRRRIKGIGPEARRYRRDACSTDKSLSPSDEALVEQRLAAHRRTPESAVPLDMMKARLRSQFKK
jgi:hypothetical protein